MKARAIHRFRQRRSERGCLRCQAQPSREELQRENERLQREVEQLRRKVTEREKQISEGEKRISEQAREIEKREKQIFDLERQLAGAQKNSTNSSKPPSSDGLAGKSRARGRGQRTHQKNRRKPGGQKGHPGCCRPLLPLERVQEVKTVLPESCQHCGRDCPSNSKTWRR